MEWKVVQRKDNDLLKIPKRWLHIHYYEALNILFRFENSVRVFVYAVLKNEFGKKWPECSFAIQNADAQSIKGTAARRISQAESFGYLGFDVRAPLMHLTSGELIELLTSDAYWPKFKAYFKGDKGTIKNKLLEIGSIRNSLAHFRPIKADDIELVKLNSRYTLVGVEECLECIFSQPLRVPTNTPDEWYKALSVLGSQQITTTPYYSADECWINVKLTFNSPVLRKEKYSDEYCTYKILKINSPHILTEHPELTQHLTYLSESLAAPKLNNALDLQIAKDLNFIFRGDQLKSKHAEIAKAISDILREIAAECELLLQDNLARGKIVESADGWSFFQKPKDGEGSWRHTYHELTEPYESKHPDEYWGQNIYASDIVAARPRYPWMPQDISHPEGAFDWLE